MPRFDELNQLKRFFSTMELSEDEKQKRCDFAFLLYEAIYYTFSFIKVDKEIAKRNSTEKTDIADSYKETLENRLEDAFKDIPHEPDYIPRLVDDIIETTNRHPDDSYYLSRDRALLIAQNESNTAYNYVDYDNAVKNGKQYKVWITENDDRVRMDHAEVDGQKIPIDEMFTVGNDKMRYPHDYVNGSADNLVNCRCVCVYE